MMHLPMLLPLQSIRLSLLLCICTLALYGCSGSSDTDSNDIQTEGASAESDFDGSVGTSDTSGTDSNASTIVDSELSTVVADSLPPSTVRVGFDITVPAYMSDELQMRLVWADVETTVQWVYGESWVVFHDLPADTESVLILTFYDRTGSITLGSYESILVTGTNASEVIQITADQFDTARWDNDYDGLSNIEELIAGMNPDVANYAQPVQPSLEFVQDKTFRLSWQTTPTAQSYRVLENPDGISGFTDISGKLETSTTQFDHRVALFSRINAQYLVQSCNGEVCADSEPLMVTGTLDNAIGYFKTSNPGNNDAFGTAISLSADGNTLAVGDETQASGIGIDQHGVTTSMYPSKGKVYVFARIDGRWQQQANLKASNADYADLFGDSVSLSGDGNTLVVGVPGEGSVATGVNGDSSDNSVVESGAVYVFVRNNGLWQEQAYVKASNSEQADRFGGIVSLSADGNTLAVGAITERSAARGINGDQYDNSALNAGAVYVFIRNGELWQQQAYVKASNTESGDFFGSSISLSADGNTLAVGALAEASAATGINGNQNDNLASYAGAVYVYVRSAVLWQQQAYLKASNTSSSDFFGDAVSFSADGNTLVVGASSEESAAVGINGDQKDNSLREAGAVYVFVRSGDHWQQQAYIKASNADNQDNFGSAVSLSGDGNTLAVGAFRESSVATGINGDQTDNSLASSGAVYVFVRHDGLWQQQAYVKASNPGKYNTFGSAVSLSEDGNTLAVGAYLESSGATGINGNQTGHSRLGLGAVYIY